MDERGNEDKDGKGFKIVDRRRFNAEGDTRSDVVEEERPRASAPPPAPERAATSTPPAGAKVQGAPSTHRIDFISFAASLATNALAALGALPEQAGASMPKNPELARDYIDILAMLEDKTRGNLTAEEASALKRLITELRLVFVDATQAPRR